LSSPVYRFVDKIEIQDLKNKIVAKVEFIEVETKGLFTGLFGKAKPQNANEPNKLEIKICKRFDGKDVPICEGDGLYTRYVQIDKQLMWRVHDPIDEWTGESEANALPSSSLLRKEIYLIAERRFPEADKSAY
jgi:hypothetical protein